MNEDEVKEENNFDVLFVSVLYVVKGRYCQYYQMVEVG